MNFSGVTAYGAGIVVPVHKFRLFGEWWKIDIEGSGKFGTNAWNAGIAYGEIDTAKPGSWELKLAYNDLLWNDDTFTHAKSIWFERINFWRLTGKVTLAKNLYLSAEYDFNYRMDLWKKSYLAGRFGRKIDGYNSWTVSLTYLF